MIIDNLANIENYKGLDKIYEVLEFIAKTDFTAMEIGKYFLDGDNVYYMVQEYDTKEDKGIAEAHKKYIDIQLIVDGDELIGYAPITVPKELVEDKGAKDCCLYSCETAKLNVKSGDFMVLYPNDLHSPGLLNGKSSKCRKVVFKVKI